VEQNENQPQDYSREAEETDLIKCQHLAGHLSTIVERHPHPVVDLKTC
jgi:hypothetical protein